jgi:hypothetical protein
VQLLASGPRDVQVKVSSQCGRSRLLVRGDKGDDGSFGSHPAGTTGAVQVVLGVRGHIEVDDTRHVVHVNTTGGDVGRYERLHLVSTECGQRAIALGLAPPAVDGLRDHTGSRELVGHPIRTVLGADKDDR